MGSDIRFFGRTIFLSGPIGQYPFTLCPVTPGPLGYNDAADPDTPNWFVGDPPGPLGIGDWAQHPNVPGTGLLLASAWKAEALTHDVAKAPRPFKRKARRLFKREADELTADVAKATAYSRDWTRSRRP